MIFLYSEIICISNDLFIFANKMSLLTRETLFFNTYPLNLVIYLPAFFLLSRILTHGKVTFAVE